MKRIISNVPSKVTISDKKTSNETGQFGYVFNNFAYVTFSWKAKNEIGMTNDFSVTIRISESGNAIWFHLF